jgi:hypothetical protein
VITREIEFQRVQEPTDNIFLFPSRSNCKKERKKKAQYFQTPELKLAPETVQEGENEDGKEKVTGVSR